MLYKQQSKHIDNDDAEHASISSPAIDTALDEWYDAKRVRDEDGLKDAARKVIDATSAYFRAGGVPLHSHRPLPPQFVQVELRDVQSLPQRHAARVVDSFVGRFDDSAKPVVAQQVASELRNQSMVAREGDASERSGGDLGAVDLFAKAQRQTVAASHATEHLYQQDEQEGTPQSLPRPILKRQSGPDMRAYESPYRAAKSPPHEEKASPPDPDDVPPEFTDLPMARNDGKPVLIWDSARTGGWFSTEEDAMRAGYRRLKMVCRGHNECGGNIYKIGNRYYYDLYQGYDPYNHNWQWRSDAVAWFHNHPGFDSEDRHQRFKADITAPMDQDPDTLRKFRDRYRRPLAAYIEHNGMIYYYKDYLSDRRGVIVPR
jgi:hypothetical protein